MSKRRLGRYFVALRNERKGQIRIRKRVIVFVVFCVGLALATSLYAKRGWIRGPFGSHVVTKLYADAVDRVYDEQVGAVNQKLENLGFQIEGSERAECYDLHFSKFRESFSCGKSHEGRGELNSDVSYLFQSESGPASMQAFMLEHGWTPDKETLFVTNDYAIFDDLGRLIDDEVGHTSVSFDKTIDDITCEIYFIYYGPSIYEAGAAFIRTSSSCFRRIDVFGGYEL